LERGCYRFARDGPPLEMTGTLMGVLSREFTGGERDNGKVPFLPLTSWMILCIVSRTRKKQLPRSRRWSYVLSVRSWWGSLPAPRIPVLLLAWGEV